MKVVLEVTKGPDAGERFVFAQHESFVIGRKKNKRVQFRIPDDPYFSRFHMLIEVSPPQCFLRDLGSRNGTYINRKKVQEAILNDGDVIHGGKSEFRVRIEADAPEVVKPFPDPGPAQEEAPAAGCPQPDQWDTQVFGQSPGAEPDKLRCAICKEVASDSWLGDLMQTRIVAYVCPSCRRNSQDPEKPVPGYEKLAVLNRGILGPVYKARRLACGRQVVLKVISRDMSERPEAVKLFLRQMLLAAGLKHPKIVPVVEMGQAGADLWLASQYIEGPDARELARQNGGKLPVVDAVDVICQVLEALDHAHGKNLVHRDLKPSNILVTGRPGGYEAFLADFGLMRNMDEAGVSGITRKGEVRGTVPFMPPEQVLDCRFVKPAGDIYGAGATLYWLLAGQLARDFDAVSAAGGRKDPYLVILEDSVIPIRHRDPSIPEPIARIVERSLQEEPEDRFQTAAEMARALRAASQKP